MSFGDNIIPFPTRGRARPEDASFLALAEEWLRTEAPRLVEPENERRHIEHLRALWALTEGELRPRQVKEALFALLRPSGSLCAATVNKVRGTGRRIIREAQLNERWAGPNPFDVVRRMREIRPVFRTLSLGECRVLLPLMREDRRREALTMLYLGLRPGEIKALQKQDVDLAAVALTVRRSNGRDTTKTGKVRVIPIPEGLLPVIDAALATSPSDSSLVFPGRGGGRQRPDAKLSRMLRDRLRTAGLVSGFEYSCRRRGCRHRETRRERCEGARCPSCKMKLWVAGVPLAIRFYDLRHSAATLHREAGADPLAIQLALGHAPETLTDSVYTHLSMEYVRRELNKLRI